MPFSNHDPHNLTELARTVVLGIQIQRRKARGKGTARQEKQVDEIRAKAEAREAARRK
ncbi:hypothetical protein GCM10010294_67840 [Streptomyces griseoloalbus]|uniref:hypothetical protein n=1 Tax=Streptomyces griseoloalbus TaxID=67303 RepID=UPI001873C956|nr:hypothetical protein GCM10010294_67840 [Streptomyces griseoloalbus]